MPLADAERARATMIELFPQGFEEVTGDQGVELVAYTDGAGEERLWHAFGTVRSSGVDDDWAERWRSFHHAVRVGPLWLGPPWETPPDDVTAVVIDPGRAFGTGGHATTQLALEFLLELPRGSLADLGCGSGVLSIAAAKLGFGPIVALDNDVQAVEAARRNARANGVDVEVRHADVLTDDMPETSCVVTNIALEPVRKLGARLRAARVITSGYLVADEIELPGYRRVDRRATGGWAADLHERE